MLDIKFQLLVIHLLKSLLNDIAKKLGTVGFLSALERISVGPYNITESKLIDEISIL